MHSGSSLGIIETINSGHNPMHSPIDAISAGTGNNNFRQIVSSSAPTSSFDLEAFVRRAGSSAGANSTSAGNGNAANIGSNGETDFFRDRRKKDIHNMSKEIFF